MQRNMLRSAVALAAVFGSLATAPKANANWFGLFHTRHQAQPVACCGTPAPVRAYVAPAPVVAASPVVAAPTACSTCNAPAAIQVPETCMQTRCYQVPVTRYETRTNYQLVTENRVSEVMEPVTTIHTSSYFDPCNCSYHQVNTPVTTMVRKQVCTPVQRYVAQHYTVPVTDYVQKCEQVPVTTMRMYVPAAAPAAVAVPTPGVVAAVPTAPAAGPPLQAVPAAPGGAQPPSNINLPNPTSAYAPQYAAAPQQQPAPQQAPQQAPQPVPQQAPERIAYNTPPANTNPNRREVIDRIFKNNELVEEHRRLVDSSSELAPVPNTGAPTTPRSPANANGSSYAIPQEPKPLPKGVKTASYVPPYTGSIALSKPYLN